MHFVISLGDDLTLTINLRDSNLAPLFRAVNHDDSNDNDGFWGDLAIQRDYCPYPVPEKYTLSLVMHQVRAEQSLEKHWKTLEFFNIPWKNPWNFLT